MKYRFIIFSPGSIGDHAIFLEAGRRFYLTTGVATYLIVKNNFDFLNSLSVGYYGFIKTVNFSSLFGKLFFIYIFLKSIFIKHYYTFFLPIIYKKYIINFSKIILKYTQSILISQSYLGLEKYSLYGLQIQSEINNKYFYQQVDEMLKVLGFNQVLSMSSLPSFLFIKDEMVKDKFKIKEKYIVIHPTPSNLERRINVDIWKKEFKKYLDQNYILVFIGSLKDKEYINLLLENTEDIDLNKIRNLCGGSDILSGQDLLNIIYFSEEFMGIHSGMAHIAAIMNKSGKIFCHLHFKQMGFEYDKNLHVEILSSIIDVKHLHETQGLIYK